MEIVDLTAGQTARGRHPCNGLELCRWVGRCRGAAVKYPGDAAVGDHWIRIAVEIDAVADANTTRTARWTASPPNRWTTTVPE